ncbi:hypothetical protein CK203_049890 [Vitis vinifera]|uniref:DUF4283 domain-containing protein n=1 Tax=Vitis vinifera TaxID=29760 RepID=A0A438GVX1_VITVI|nr:hypothetical protein CK203_049890 [Vitis vinifera]
MVKMLKVFVERNTFLVRFEGESGGIWCSLTKHSRGSIFTLGFEKKEVGWLIEHLAKVIELKSYMGFNRKYRGNSRVHLMKVCFNNHGRSFVNVVKEEGPGRESLVPIGRWVRAVVYECLTIFVNWAEVGRALVKFLGQKVVELRFLKIKGRYTTHLRRWSPRENSEVVGKFKGGWIELWGLSFHLWSEVHLKKIVE